MDQYFEVYGDDGNMSHGYHILLVRAADKDEAHKKAREYFEEEDAGFEVSEAETELHEGPLRLEGQDVWPLS